MIGKAIALAGTALLIASAAACRREAPPEQDRPRQRSATRLRHPTPENLPSGNRLAASIGRNRSVDDASLNRLAARLRSADPILRIGRMEGAPEEVFGVVEDVAPGEDGSFWVLDSRYNNVREYGPDGRLIRSFGGPGRGPDELMSPEAMERDRDGRLIVADRHNRLKIFAAQGQEFRAAETVSVRFTPEDFCLLGDRIYVQAASTQGKVVHAFTIDGGPAGSFADGYRSPNALVRNQLSDGPIGCSEAAGVVAFMPKYLPVVYGYTAGGSLRWVSRLVDFEPMDMLEEVDEQGRPVLHFNPPPGGFDFAAGITPVPGGFLLVQVGRHTPESVRARSEFAELHSYLLSAATGAGVYVGSTLPRVLATADGRLYGADSDPFPRVAVYHFEGTGS